MMTKINSSAPTCANPPDDSQNQKGARYLLGVLCVKNQVTDLCDRKDEHQIEEKLQVRNSDR